jgi:hypothetical protein
MEYMPLAQIPRATRNPKTHDRDLIRKSIQQFGCTLAGVLDERTGRLVAGHGRLAVLDDLHAAGETPPSGIRISDLGWLVPIVRGWSSKSDADAEAYVIADNRVGELGGWDHSTLTDVLGDLAADNPDLLSVTGYTADDLDTLLTDITTGDAESEYETASRNAKAPKLRTHPLDAIFTINPHGLRAWIAHATGFKIGCQSSATHVLKSRDRWEHIYPLTFIDNEWHDYDHPKHLDFVAAFRPKYATVRDVMTRQQCRDAGVTYYPLDKVLAMAADVADHAENVIIIPKFDCIADIPDHHMLGYSVPSSYGATPLPAERFKGRRVHLLGGPWRAQRTYLTLLGEDVVSLDFNHVLFEAKFGGFALPDGGRGEVNRDLHQYPTNGGLVSLALSLGNIGRAIHDITADTADPFATTEEPADQEPTIDR